MGTALPKSAQHRPGDCLGAWLCRSAHARVHAMRSTWSANESQVQDFMSYIASSDHSQLSLIERLLHMPMQCPCSVAHPTPLQAFVYNVPGLNYELTLLPGACKYKVRGFRY